LKVSDDLPTLHPLWGLRHLPGASIGDRFADPSPAANTYELRLSWDGGKPFPPPPSRPFRSPATAAAARQIERDGVLYRASIRFMEEPPQAGLDAVSELALRLHAMMLALAEDCAGADFVEIAADLLAVRAERADLL
jgi:hypothetical protein